MPGVAVVSFQSEQLKERTKAFSVAILRLVDKLPTTIGAQVVGRQLARSATSIGANYLAACNARSRSEFIAKLCIVNEESDETVGWLDIIQGVPYLAPAMVEPHRREAFELRAIFGRSLSTSRHNAGAAHPDLRQRTRT